MLALMIGEFKKLFKDVKNLLCLAFFIVFIIGFVFLNEKAEIMNENGWKDKLQLRSRSVESRVRKIGEEIEKKGGISSSKDEEDLKFLYDHQSLISNLISEYKKKSLQGYLKAEKEVQLHAIEGMEKNIDFNDIESKWEHQHRIEKVDVFAEKNIVPVFEDYSMQGYNFLRLCSSNIIIIILVLVVFNFTIESFSSEAEKHTYKLLFTQPISKTKIFFSKFLARFIIVAMVITVVIVAFFLFLGVKNGFGNLEYPTEMITGGRLGFVPLGQFLSASILILTVVLVFIFCFSILISCVFNSTSTSATISVIVPIVALCIGALIPGIKAFIPFSYIPINDYLCSSGFGVMSGNVNGTIIMFLLINFFLIAMALWRLKTKVYKK